MKRLRRRRKRKRKISYAKIKRQHTSRLIKKLKNQKMTQTKDKTVIWECLECGNQYTSYSNKRHDMQICECGKSGYDLEEHYARVKGNLKIISVNGVNENEFHPMRNEIKIIKHTHYIMETELGPHGKEYTTYKRNNNENWEVLMDEQFSQIGRSSEKELENLFQNYKKI